MVYPIRLLAGMALLVLTTGAFAQTGPDSLPPDDSSAATEEPKVLQPIEVTGYHIKRMDIEGPAPVLVFNRADLEQAGVNTLEEFARYLPINNPERPLRFNTVGAAVFDLRGIGVDTTLTLINGMRIAPYAQSAENYIDVNSIPVSAIERIEILKDGASAIYGADAIAGVVNIILRRGFDGMELSAGYGVSEEGDGEEMMADFVAGMDSGRGGFMFSLSWYDREPQAMRDRDWSADADFSALGGPNRRHPWSSPPSVYPYSGWVWVPDPACGTDPLLTSVGDGPFGSEYGTGCRFNFAQFQDQHWAFERIGASLSGHYEISGNLSLFGDLIYSDTTGEARQAPNGIPAPVGGFTLGGGPYVLASHPGNPFGDDVEIYSRLLDGGERVHTNESEAWRVVAGLEGAWGDWDWRLSALFSENEVAKTYRNLPSRSRYQDALLGMGGPDGNQFYNPFGFEPQNDPELVDWIKTDATQQDTSEERSVDLLFSRLFGSLPGGPVGVAVGLQYREQTLDQWADENLLSGDLSHFHDPVSADRDITSAYVEFRLPLWSSFEAQLALRYEDYSDFGSTTNPKIALRWQPNETLLLRGSWGTSFKPPSFHELYQPVQEDFWWYVDVERCVLTGLPEDCGDTLYPLEYGGNPNLDPEEGESWFAGTVWTPEFMPGFEFQLDFWEFRHEDRIEWLDAQLVLDEKGSFGIVRAPTEDDGTPGRIILIQESRINADVLETRGFDTTLRYRWSAGRAGIFRASLMHTYIDTWNFTESLDEALIDREFAGKYRRVPVPRNRANLNFSWDLGAHGAAANIHYTGSYENHTNLYVDGERTDQPMIISSHTTLDLQYRYTFERLRRAVVRVGCNNVIDEDPPINYGGLEPMHDGRGRFFYIRWQQPFR